jgi:hypothetical protein
MADFRTRWHAALSATMLAWATSAIAGDANSASAPPRVEGHIKAESEQAKRSPVTPESANTSDYSSDTWWAPGVARAFPEQQTFANTSGALTVLRTGAPLDTQGHPFFSALGTNGRACVTCHQPADGMSLSTQTIQKRWETSKGKDPLFAPVDGANCPDLPQAQRSSHSLLLDRGLFRVFRPWPPKAADGSTIDPEFTLEVVRDPTGCNLHPRYGVHSANPMVSVYRRPRPVANVKYLTAVGFPFEPKNGLPLPLDPETGAPTSGNIMADARNRTLKSQALEAALVHLQATAEPTDVQLRQILDFESTVFSAQGVDRWGGALTEAGARGGPTTLQESLAGELQGGPKSIWNEFAAWAKPSAAGNEEQRLFRESVARGANVFANKTFLIRDAAGLTSIGFGNPVRNACAFCHNMMRTGMDVAPGQVDLGTTNEPFANPAPELPLFKLTCKEQYRPHPHLGRVVYTQDPGYALTTGKCRDIGKITIQQMRGLAARAPYFSNGSARTLRDIVDFYDRRYSIGYTEQEKQDLVNLMSVL